MVEQNRVEYVAEGDVWKRWRCDCGKRFVLLKNEAKAKIAALRPRGDFFVVACECGVQHVFKRK